MPEYILFDTETTGLEDVDRIIQVGAIIIDENQSVTPYDELCYIEQPIHYEAMEVHGITPDMLAGKPRFNDLYFTTKLAELNVPDNYLIAHNMPFDLKMISKEGFTPKLKLIDTLQCAKHLYPDSPNHRLQYFRYALGLYKDELEEANKYGITIKAHDALGDVLIMKLFLRELVKLVKNQYPNDNPMLKLVELSGAPALIKMFNFGKYKGKTLEVVKGLNRGYLSWMLDQTDLDINLRYSIEKVLC